MTVNDLIAAFFDALMEHTGYGAHVTVPIKGREDRRRAYRGDFKQPKLDRSFANSWYEDYDRETSKAQDACAATAQRYESRLSKFGYSLMNVRELKLTSFMEEYLLPYEIAHFE